MCYKHSNELDIQTMEPFSSINLVSLSALSAHVNRLQLRACALSECYQFSHLWHIRSQMNSTYVHVFCYTSLCTSSTLDTLSIFPF